MKKYMIALAALAAVVSCKSLKEEWEPVFTIHQPDAAYYLPYTEDRLREEEGLEEFISIAALKDMYTGGPLSIEQNLWIKGRVISSDETGNVNKELYIQDGATASDGASISVKLGKDSMYNEYPLGSWVFVKCQGLTLGAYNGMVQLGMGPDQTVTNEHETAYLSLQGIIEAHIFRGFPDQRIEALSLTEDALKKALAAGGSDHLWGKVVTIKGCVYSEEVFALFYPNPNMPHKSSNPENRVFLADGGTWGVTTWGCTQEDYVYYLSSGLWDEAQVGSGGSRFGPITGTPNQYLDSETAAKFGSDAFLSYKEIMIKYASSNYIAHYFKVGETPVQVRTSGFAKFAGAQLESGILEKKPVTITGILTVHEGEAQFTLIDNPIISVIVE